MFLCYFLGSQEAKNERVKEIISELRLENCQNTLVF